jgi:hypothetical protein
LSEFFQTRFAIDILVAALHVIKGQPHQWNNQQSDIKIHVREYCVYVVERTVLDAFLSEYKEQQPRDKCGKEVRTNIFRRLQFFIHRSNDSGF